MGEKAAAATGEDGEGEETTTGLRVREEGHAAASGMERRQRRAPAPLVACSSLLILSLQKGHGRTYSEKRLLEGS